MPPDTTAVGACQAERCRAALHSEFASEKAKRSVRRARDEYPRRTSRWAACCRLHRQHLLPMKQSQHQPGAAPSEAASSTSPQNDMALVAAKRAHSPICANSIVTPKFHQPSSPPSSPHLHRRRPGGKARRHTRHVPVQREQELYELHRHAQASPRPGSPRPLLAAASLATPRPSATPPPLPGTVPLEYFPARARHCARPRARCTCSVGRSRSQLHRAERASRSPTLRPRSATPRTKAATANILSRNQSLSSKKNVPGRYVARVARRRCSSRTGRICTTR